MKLNKYMDKEIVEVEQWFDENNKMVKQTWNGIEVPTDNLAKIQNVKTYTQHHVYELFEASKKFKGYKIIEE